jgi:hypothetical protein
MKILALIFAAWLARRRERQQSAELIALDAQLQLTCHYPARRFSTE